MAEQITTAAELDALPVGSVVLDRDCCPLSKHPILGWWAYAQYGIDPDMVILDGAPLTVVHVPGRDLIAEAEARGARQASEPYAQFLDDLAAILVAGFNATDPADGHRFYRKIETLLCDALPIAARAEQAGGDRG